MIDFIRLYANSNMNSFTKVILEQFWVDVEELAMSKFRCIDYWNAGLDELLKFKKVRSILDIYRNGIEVIEKIDEGV